MADEINFVDLACLLRITPDTTLEKFGSAINASIFDASNLAGTLKQKSLIDFSSYYPGPNTIVVSDMGKALLSEAESKSSNPLDKLDQEILFQMSGGKRLPVELQNTLNIRSKDLALRLYKLYKQGLIIYDLKSGGADLHLTENGFLKAKELQPQQAPPPQPQQEQPAPSVAEQPLVQPQPPQMQPAKSSQRRTLYISLIVLIAIIIVLYYFVFVAKLGV